MSQENFAILKPDPGDAQTMPIGVLQIVYSNPLKSIFDRRVHPYPAGGPKWTRKSRHDFWTGKKPSAKAADCYLCAQRAMVGAAPA